MWPRKSKDKELVPCTSAPTLASKSFYLPGTSWHQPSSLQPPQPELGPFLRSPVEGRGGSSSSGHVRLRPRPSNDSLIRERAEVSKLERKRSSRSKEKHGKTVFVRHPETVKNIQDQRPSPLDEWTHFLHVHVPGPVHATRSELTRSERAN